MWPPRRNDAPLCSRYSGEFLTRKTMGFSLQSEQSISQPLKCWLKSSIFNPTTRGSVLQRNKCSWASGRRQHTRTPAAAAVVHSLLAVQVPRRLGRLTEREAGLRPSKAAACCVKKSVRVAETAAVREKVQACSRCVSAQFSMAATRHWIQTSPGCDINRREQGAGGAAWGERERGREGEAGDETRDAWIILELHWN